MHTDSDLAPGADRPVGGRDSEQVRLARGLLSDSETKVIFPPAARRARPRGRPLPAERARDGDRGCAAEGLGAVEGWQPGVPVEHVLGAREKEITWTDARMAGRWGDTTSELRRAPSSTAGVGR
jgi:hypothetical protein